MKTPWKIPQKMGPLRDLFLRQGDEKKNDLLGDDRLGGSQKAYFSSMITSLYIYIYLPMDPNTFLGSVWGMICGVEYLLRRCLDP